MRQTTEIITTALSFVYSPCETLLLNHCQSHGSVPTYPYHFCSYGNSRGGQDHPSHVQHWRYFWIRRPPPGKYEFSLEISEELAFYLVYDNNNPD
jgi:hypothetical protein